MIALALAVLTLAPLLAAPSEAAVNVPVTQTLSGIGTFTGSLAITTFDVANGQLMAVGTLSGQIRDANGNLLGTPVTQVAAPAQASGTCQILHLQLGPLTLSLLGLNVDLSEVVLDITAQQGTGNLLGNLLCSIAGLLDNGGPLSQLANQLNQVLRVLG